ncbi:hypothetical protein QCA50_011794 [Cerrena zonata]|uniref:Uncharacterized protein n=1 Tax=Cerrena zonata TaxID=2478898 RepID=A0AAW0FZT1_9APHY
MAKASALGEKGPPRLSLLTFTIAKHSKVAMLIGFLVITSFARKMSAYELTAQNMNPA